MSSRSLARITVLDVLLIAAVLASAVVFHIRVLGGPDGTMAAHVYRDGRLVQVLPLGQDRVVEVPGGNVVVEVRDNRVRIRESDCPKRVCVRTGWIDRPGRPIVCLPNRVVIQVKGGRTELDAETH